MHPSPHPDKQTTEGAHVESPEQMRSSQKTVFFFFRESTQRRNALNQAPVGSAERYCLFGMDQFAAHGYRTQSNMDSGGVPSRAARLLGKSISNVWQLFGGCGGDFASVWPCLQQANEADVIVSTVDSVGLPLLFFKQLGWVRRPIVYVSIGLPDRLKRLRNPWMRRAYRRTLSQLGALVAYGHGETRELREWLADGGHDAPVRFVPFGVDADYFQPDPDARPEVDVVSIGIDSYRDYPLLAGVLQSHPEISGKIVAGKRHLRNLRVELPNLHIGPEVPFADIRGLMARARMVVLPVRQNSYSGATTVLLQAMAMAKPVVVSSTHAIENGYHLEDGVNCRLVRPGHHGELEQAILDLRSDATRARTIGMNARATVLRYHTWDRYAADLLATTEVLLRQSPS